MQTEAEINYTAAETGPSMERALAATALPWT